MSVTYVEIPHNWSEVEGFFEKDESKVISDIITSPKLFFYDTCSFRRHANLSEERRKTIADYFKQKQGMLVITRCILMELASRSGYFNAEYVSYFKTLYNSGLKIAIFDEEKLFDVLYVCFSTQQKVNEYLMWAVRMSRSPISTITKTLKNDSRLSTELYDGSNLNQSNVYSRFFKAVRTNKEAADNLGEELIGICIHILSHLPGIIDGKLCVITDDKGAASKIYSLLRRTNRQYQGAKIIIFSTPKMVQYMYQEHMELEKEDLVEILSQGTDGNIVVKGTTAYDLEINDEISLTCEALADKIMEPNGIHIIF